jgi:hypothetical protein
VHHACCKTCGHHHNAPRICSWRTASEVKDIKRCVKIYLKGVE